MNGRALFRRTIGTGLAIRLAVVLAVVLLSVALIAPLALSGRTAAPSGSATSSSSLRASGITSSLSPAASTTPTLSADASIPAFPSIAVDAAATPGTFQSGEVAVYADASGGKLLIRFRDVQQVADPTGVKPSAPGDVFLEATLDAKALSATTFPSLQKLFGGTQLPAGSAWPTPALVTPDSLAAGQIVSGKLGFEVPPTGEVQMYLGGLPAVAVRLEFRPAPTGPAPSPVPPDGWPVTFDSKGEPFVGPDGTVYVGNIALDASGHLVSSAHMALPGAQSVSPAAFGADGTSYMTGQTADQSTTLIGAFGPDGQIRSGWPVAVEGLDRIIPVPTGGAYVVSSTNTAAATRLLGPDGALRASWPLAAGGSAMAGSDGLYDLQVDSNGLASHIEVLGTKGSRSAGKAIDWQSIGVAPSGTVYAWTWDLAAGSDTKVTRTRIAAIGSDGNPKPGWPVSIPGSASAPAFGADGTVYLTLGPSRVTSSVLALDPNGHTKQGWPVSLPAGYTALSDGGSWHWPDIAQAPTPRAGGTLYVAAETADGKPLVAAFDAGGHVEAGWPYRPPSSFTRFGAAIGGYTNETAPLFAPSESGGLLYLVLKDRIVALSGDGKVAPGWPKELTDENSWTATTDGGLVVGVSWYDAGTNMHTTVTRWTPAGDIAN
jgi:hypothetical protein